MAILSLFRQFPCPGLEGLNLSFCHALNKPGKIWNALGEKGMQSVIILASHESFAFYKLLFGEFFGNLENDALHHDRPEQCKNVFLSLLIVVLYTKFRTE